MSSKGQVLLIDSTGHRRKELSELWSNVLGYDVVSHGGSDFSRVRHDGGVEKLSPGELSNVQPLVCLFHAGDFQKYENTVVKKLVDSSRRVVMFSGVGIPGAKPDWPAEWFWIPRAIMGKDSASDREWRQLGDWFETELAGPTDAKSLELLSIRKRPHFLIAIYILCQGFLAAERMRGRPAAIIQTRKRDWWSVPLLKSADGKLVDIVKQEWGGDVPDSVLQFVKWIAGDTGSEGLELVKIVPEAKKELECRIAK
jgi:hypothetical protein